MGLIYVQAWATFSGGYLLEPLPNRQIPIDIQRLLLGDGALALPRTRRFVYPEVPSRALRLLGGTALFEAAWELLRRPMHRPSGRATASSAALQYVEGVRRLLRRLAAKALTRLISMFAAGTGEAAGDADAAAEQPDADEPQPAEGEPTATEDDLPVDERPESDEAQAELPQDEHPTDEEPAATKDDVPENKEPEPKEPQADTAQDEQLPKPEDEQEEEEAPPEEVGAGAKGFPMWKLCLGGILVLALAAVVIAVALGHSAASGVPQGGADAALAGGGQTVESKDDGVWAVERLAALGYDELISLGDGCVDAKNWEYAERCYRAAAKKEGESLARSLVAQSRLSLALVSLGKYEEALEIVQSLLSVSRPGDELWRNALITSVAIRGEQQRWKEMFRDLYRLQANCTRYRDSEALTRWVIYRKAMAKVSVSLALLGEKGCLYESEPPVFGRGASPQRLVAEQDIAAAPTSGGDGSLSSQWQDGLLHLRSEGAPLRTVLGETANGAGWNISCKDQGKQLITARLTGAPPEEALEVILGSVGLEASREGERLVVGDMEPGRKSAEDAREAALTACQEFLILFPESAHVPEAYYALAHLYMTQGRQQMALDQLVILADEFPQSPWTAWGHYAAGRAWGEMGKSDLAERELLLLVDSSEEHPLCARAFFWAGHYQMEQRKYEQAAASFQRAASLAGTQEFSAQALYGVARCMEEGGYARADVEEKYHEVKARFAGTEHARLADYRLARMALDAKDFGEAATRYEHILSEWPVEGEFAKTTCCDLIHCYLQSGQHVRAVVLGQLMRSRFSKAAEIRELLPLLVEVYEKADMEESALQLVEQSLALLPDASERPALMLEKARIQVELGRYAEAESVLAEIEDAGASAGSVKPDEQLLHGVRLLRAKICMAQGKDDAGFDLCLQVAHKCESAALRAKALRMIGAYYERKMEFDRAALAYSGKCPLNATGDGQ